MNTKDRFKLACFSGLRVGFCTALATALSVGMVATVSMLSPSAENRLATTLRRLPVIDKIFDWGLIPAVAAFVTVSFLGFALWELGLYCGFSHCLSRYCPSMHNLEILISAFAGIAHAAINLYSLKAEGLDYGVNVPLASLVGAVAAANEIPRKLARFLFTQCHQRIFKGCLVPQDPALFVITHSYQAASINTAQATQVQAQTQVQITPRYSLPSLKESREAVSSPIKNYSHESYQSLDQAYI